MRRCNASGRISSRGLHVGISLRERAAKTFVIVRSNVLMEEKVSAMKDKTKSMGWFEKKALERSVERAIAAVVRNVERTIEKNPGLSMEEALKIVDKKQSVFFPGEQHDGDDLKSLFAGMVWKSYKRAHLQNPEASSPEHREMVFDLVRRYLGAGGRNQKAGFVKIVKPVFSAVGIVIFVFALSYDSNISRMVKPTGKEPERPSAEEMVSPSKPNQAVIVSVTEKKPQKADSSAMPFFRYHGFASDESRRSALVNKAIYREGEGLDEDDRYILKSIHPKYIIIEDTKDQSEFSVALQ